MGGTLWSKVNSYMFILFQGNVCSIKEVPFRGVNCSDAAGSQKEYQLIQNLLKGNSTMGGRQWSKAYKAPFFNFKVSSWSRAGGKWIKKLEGSIQGKLKLILYYGC